SVGSSGSTAITAGTAASLNTVSGIDVSTAKGASNALKVLDSALANVNSQRASFGALQSRFETAVTNLESTSENLSASRSRIQDTDFASETAKLTRGQILQQAGTAMLAQANSLPNGVLSLLRG
ncbi:flagellin, partial [Massilia sp. DJPM01]